MLGTYTSSEGVAVGIIPPLEGESLDTLAPTDAIPPFPAADAYVKQMPQSDLSVKQLQQLPRGPSPTQQQSRSSTFNGSDAESLSGVPAPQTLPRSKTSSRRGNAGNSSPPSAGVALSRSASLSSRKRTSTSSSASGGANANISSEDDGPHGSSRLDKGTLSDANSAHSGGNMDARSINGEESCSELPPGSKRDQAQKLMHKLFKGLIPASEVVFNEHICAYQRNTVLQQGKIYLTENYFCFSSNILGFQTTVVTPIEDIMSIERAKTMMVIPNAIIVTCKDKQDFYASFMNREAAYANMKYLINAYRFRHMGESSPLPSTPRTSMSNSPNAPDLTRSSSLHSLVFSSSTTLTNVNPPPPTIITTRADSYGPSFQAGQDENGNNLPTHRVPLRAPSSDEAGSAASDDERILLRKGAAIARSSGGSANGSPLRTRPAQTSSFPTAAANRRSWSKELQQLMSDDDNPGPTNNDSPKRTGPPPTTTQQLQYQHQQQQPHHHTTRRQNSTNSNASAGSQSGSRIKRRGSSSSNSLLLPPANSVWSVGGAGLGFGFSRGGSAGSLQGVSPVVAVLVVSIIFLCFVLAIGSSVVLWRVRGIVYALEDVAVQIKMGV
ncbi:hypothetical protein HK101_004355 [Irineochytrium annulatum]|nr:hypothetical protein HK101_004355 [Irineochytrium annulatum]